MAYTTINKPNEHFNTVLYTGDGSGSARTITGVGFQPDWLWNKSRSNAYNHYIFDVLRGTNMISSNATTQEEDKSPQFSAFTSDGFTITNDAGSLAINASGVTFANWCWKANGSGVSNTDGSITSTVSANTASGFSIVSYTGNATDGATVGHGLGANPAMIIFKNRIDSSSAKWAVYHKGAFVSQADPNILYLDDAGVEADDTNVLGGSSVTLNSTVFSLGSYNGSNGSSDNIIAYCFAEKKGFSKFGRYIGNANTNGTFIYTGFKPAWFLIRPTGGGQWFVWDNKRNPINEAQQILSPESTSAEGGGAGSAIDFLSNGIKMRNIDGGINGNGATYIYMAFASEPLVGTNNIPATAR